MADVLLRAAGRGLCRRRGLGGGAVLDGGLRRAVCCAAAVARRAGCHSHTRALCRTTVRYVSVHARRCAGGLGLSLNSRGLFTGVCTLCWLTARLWGGAPLQLGTAANAVCAAGQALLAALALALALTLRGRAREHKPARQEHVRERARVVRHTLLLLTTTAATQSAGVAYVQSADNSATRAVVLAAAALVNVSRLHTY